MIQAVFRCSILAHILQRSGWAEGGCGLSGMVDAGGGGSQPPGEASPAGVDTEKAASARDQDSLAPGLRRRRVPEHLLAFLLFAGLSLLILGPRILGRMSTSFLSSQPQDGSIFVWMFRWWPYALGHHIDPLFTSVAWAPRGINLAWVTSVPALAVPMAPVTQAFGPFFAFNVVELAAPALASWTGYLLCRRITGAFVPALLGGLCFGFSPFLMGEVGQGHPNLAQECLVPLAAYLVLRRLEGSIRDRWFVPLLGLLLAVQLYLSTEVFATMTLMGALFAAIGLVVGGDAWRQRLWRRATGPVAGAYAVALALGSPLLYAAFSRPRPYKPVYFPGLTRGAQSVSDFLGYVIPGRFSILGEQFGHRWGRDGNPWYFGVPLLLLFVLFLIAERRRRRAWALTAGLVVTLALSAGSTLAVFGVHILPWRLVSALPVLDQAQPGRLVSYAFLILGVAMAMWLASPARQPVHWALAALALLFIVPNVTSNVWVRQVPEPPLLASGAYHQYLTPGETVWVVDSLHSRQMIWQAETHFSFRLAGGFFGVTPAGLRPSPAVQAELGTGTVTGASVTGIRAFLASHHVGAVLMAEEPGADARVIARATGVTGVRRGGMVVFQLTSAAR
jgi:hypothetical protein